MGVSNISWLFDTLVALRVAIRHTLFGEKASRKGERCARREKMRLDG